MLDTRSLKNGREQYERFTRRKKQMVQYDYRSNDGELYSTIKPNLALCHIDRDYWLMRRSLFKEILDLIGKSQKAVEIIYPYCPRCGHNKMDKNLYHNSLSRFADVYICNDCGMDEAMRDSFGTPLPFTQWSWIYSLKQQEKLFIGGGEE